MLLKAEEHVCLAQKVKRKSLSRKICVLKLLTYLNMKINLSTLLVSTTPTSSIRNNDSKRIWQRLRYSFFFFLSNYKAWGWNHLLSFTQFPIVKCYVYAWCDYVNVLIKFDVLYCTFCFQQNKKVILEVCFLWLCSGINRVHALWEQEMLPFGLSCLDTT